jgi:dihydrofolate reductase
MPDIIYYVAASVDGYIATPDGGIGWLAPFESSAEDYGYASFYSSVDAVILGSHTYEQAIGFGEWPYPDKPVRVASSRRLEVAAPNVVVTADDPASIVRELGQGGAGRIWLVGGGMLAGAFARAGLIDEYIVSVMPVLLGEGVALLGASATCVGLELVTTKTFGDGVIQSVYRPAR